MIDNKKIGESVNLKIWREEKEINYLTRLPPWILTRRGPRWSTGPKAMALVSKVNLSAMFVNTSQLFLPSTLSLFL